MFHVVSFLRTINSVLGKGAVNRAMSDALQQSKGFARALLAYGTPVVSDRPVVIERGFGPFGTISFASRVRPEALQETSVRIINAEADCPDTYRALGYHQMMTPAHVAEWDLATHDRRGAMRPKWRNQLRKAESHGLRLRELVWDGRPHWLLRQAAAMARKRRFRTLPTALLACFAQTNKGDALIFEAYAKDHPIAAILSLRHGATATYQTGWTSTKGRALHAHNQLLDHAARRLAKLGHSTFDLGLVETDSAPTLTHFKCGTGAAIRRLGGTWIRLGRTQR